MSHRRGSIACVVALAVARLAHGDGGVPIGSSRREVATHTLLVSPASPAVGAVEFTLLGPGAASARLRLIEGDDVPQELAFAPGSGTPGALARTTLESAGACRFEVRLEGEVAPLLVGELPVQPAPAAWLARWPWLFAWLPAAALLALRAIAERDRAVSYTRAPRR